MYTLKDTFNDRVISRHHTLRAAATSQHEHLRAVKRDNGENSYLTYAVLDADGANVMHYDHPEHDDWLYECDRASKPAAYR